MQSGACQASTHLGLCTLAEFSGGTSQANALMVKRLTSDFKNLNISNGFVKNHYDEDTAARYNLELVALGEIYFHKDADTAIGATSSFTRVNILSAIAILIFTIAIFNYINLSTAQSQSVDKAKETGVRKVVGASVTISKLSNYFLSLPHGTKRTPYQAF
jgi:hypothetical protein